MNLNYLEFENPIVELEAKIDELRRVGIGRDINITEEIGRLERKRDELIRNVFVSLSPQQIVQMARHPLRPYTLDYIQHIFTDFDELHGDRHCAQGTSIVGGIARLDQRPVMIVGHQKGRNTKEKLRRNFGMPNPDAFRKALRLFKLAEKFHLPIFTFIDTPGAYPGVQAEERNQSEAIARNLFEMSQLKTPIICTVTGEGCSGGALAVGVGDRLLMLQFSYYSVISPEGCASILWKRADRASDAAAALRLTAQELQALHLIDDVISEPLGGAHRNVKAMGDSLKQALLKHLDELDQLNSSELLEQRYDKWMKIGQR